MGFRDEGFAAMVWAVLSATFSLPVARPRLSDLVVCPGVRTRTSGLSGEAPTGITLNPKP